MTGLTRRDLMRSSLGSVVVGALGARLGTSPALGKTTGKPVPPAPTPAAGAAFRPYGADSYFQSRVTGAPIDSTLTGQFRSFMKSHPDQVGKPYPYINGITASNRWGTAYAEGSATDPIWRLTGTVPSAASFLGTRGFHAPEWLGSMFSGTSDSPFVCMDRGYGISVWAANAKVVAPYTIQVGAAGYFTHASPPIQLDGELPVSRVHPRCHGDPPRPDGHSDSERDRTRSRAPHVPRRDQHRGGVPPPHDRDREWQVRLGAGAPRAPASRSLLLLISPNAACHPLVSSWPAHFSSMVATSATTQDQGPP